MSQSGVTTMSKETYRYSGNIERICDEIKEHIDQLDIVKSNGIYRGYDGGSEIVRSRVQGMKEVYSILVHKLQCLEGGWRGYEYEEGNQFKNEEKDND